MTTIEVIENLDDMLHMDLDCETDNELMEQWLWVKDKLIERLKKISIDTIVNTLREKGWDFTLYHDEEEQVRFIYRNGVIDTKEKGYEEVLRVLTEDDDELTPFI